MTITTKEPMPQEFQTFELIKQPRRSPNLMLHCGAHVVTRDDVETACTPEPTKTWMPIAHSRLLRETESTLIANGLSMGTQAHSLTKNGARYFGLIEVRRENCNLDYCWVLGLRNSHDRSFSAGITAGASVFVCDNLSFSGEVKLARRHTRFIERDISSIVQSAIGKLMDRWHNQDSRIEAYKNAGLSHKDAHDLLIRAADVRICPPQSIPHVLKEWRTPRHSEFQAQNVWSFFNAITEVLKGNLHQLPRRTESLHGLLDNHVGLAN